MRARGIMIAGVAAAMLVVMAALWGWQSAPRIVSAWEGHPELALWGVRSGVVAAVAAAQVVLLGVVSHCMFGRDAVTDLLRASGTVLSLAAAAGAVLLGLASR
jgi:hypothetical protein